MKKTVKTLGILMLGFALNAQVDNPFEDIQNAYEEALDDYEVFDNCGSGLDGFAAAARKIENKLLDAAVQLSIQDEYEIGLAYREHLREEVSFVHNMVLENQLSVMLIDTVISPYVQRQGIRYSITIVDDESVNAFATNGGFIYLTTGLLGFIQSVDELAFIIAHEITHIDMEHVSRAVKRTLVMRELSSSYDMEDYEDMMTEMKDKAYLPFGQVDEYEADRNAFYMARAAGFNPERFADFFKRLIQYEDSEQEMLEKLSRTHPYSRDRINCINYYIANP
ncbi:MAG: hypothetical protein DA405_07660 [Bacteroidetes bacterium]|nr:MAG: hypothetical protein DA405_07660 [Bacteroidota bacterium]